MKKRNTLKKYNNIPTTVLEVSELTPGVVQTNINDIDDKN